MLTTTKSVDIASLSSAQVELLQGAIRALAGVCDGAVTDDGVGFNATHTSLGHSLASMPITLWDTDCYNYAYSLALFYQLQLAQMGYPTSAIRSIPLEEIEITGGAAKVKAKVAELAIVGARKIGAVIDTDNLPTSYFTICWKREDKEFNTYYQLVKASKLARWLSDKNCWTLPARQEAISIIDTLAIEHGFVLGEGVQDLLDMIEQGQIIYYPGRITPLNGSSLAISFDYNADLVARIKSLVASDLSKCRWDPNKRTWTASIAMLPRLVDKFPTFFLDPSLAPKLEEIRAKQPSSTIDKLTPAEQARVDAEIAECKARLALPIKDGRVPRDYQIEGSIFLLGENKAILAYDVGLGKTLTALIAAREVGLPIIVVAPASTMTNWLREAASVPIDIKIYSWNKFPDIETLEAKKFSVILDEGHKAKAGTKTGFGKNALAISEKAASVFILTGTPMPNGRPRETYPLLKMVGHPIAQSKSYYDKRYCQGHMGRFGWDNSGASNLDEWSRLTKNKLLVKKKEDCLSLPPLMRAMLTIDGDDQDRAIYSSTLQKLATEYRDRVAKGAIQPADALVMMGILRRCSSMIKSKYAIEKCQEILDANPTDKVLIFTDFIQSAEIISTHFGCDSLQGDVPTNKRQAMVDKLFNTPTRVLVTTRAGGEGLNIQAANHLILVDRTFVPKDYVQFEGRSHRSGQAKTVFSYWLQYNSSDSHIDSVIQQKQERIELALEGERKTMRGIASPGEIAIEVLEKLFGGKS